MPRLPVVSGEKLIKLLTGLGYQVLRQKGSHVRLAKETEMGTHKTTVPLHDPLAKGTLNDILSKVTLWTGISKKKLIEMLGR